MDEESAKKWDDDPSTQLRDMQTVEWGLLESYMYLVKMAAPEE